MDGIFIYPHKVQLQPETVFCNLSKLKSDYCATRLVRGLSAYHQVFEAYEAKCALLEPFESTAVETIISIACSLHSYLPIRVYSNATNVN